MILKDFTEFKSLLGTTLKPSAWLEVEQEMIDHFAEATKDYQWIHVDKQHDKKKSPYKLSIAHGFMSIALIPLKWHIIMALRKFVFHTLS